MKNLTVLLMLTGFNIAAFSQTYENCPGIEWENSYGGTLDERMGYAIATPDSGFLLSGSSRSTDVHLAVNKGGRDAAIIKIDAAGQFLWSRVYGGPEDDEIRAMVLAPGGGYFFCGRSGAVGGDISDNFGQSDSWVGKVSESGTLEWQQSYGSSNADYAYAIRPTTEGGCIALGISNNSSSELARFSSEGNLLWRRNYTHLRPAAPLMSAEDGNFYLSSNSHILKMGPEGNFTDSIPLPFSIIPLSIKETPDGGLILVGNTFLSIYEGIIALKVDETGTLIWETRFNLGQYQDTRDVFHTGEGDFYILSRLQNSGPPIISDDYDYCLSWLDSAGQILQHRILGGSLGDAPQSLVPTTDGGLLLSGDSHSTDGDISDPIGQWDFWVVKMGYPAPFSLPSDTTYCQASPLQLAITTQPSSVDILWNNGSQDSTIIINESGQFWVRASLSGCTLTDTIDVRMPLAEWDGLPTDTALCEKASFLLDASLEGAALYLWQDGSNDPTFEVNKPDRYLVKVVIDECTLTDSITVRWCEPCVALPNAFTPNGDGVNDFFAPLIQCPLLAYQFQVFNRWGKLVFESDSPEETWDGSVEGKPAPAEIYFYQLAYMPFPGEPVERRQGDVALLR